MTDQLSSDRRPIILWFLSSSWFSSALEDEQELCITVLIWSLPWDILKWMLFNSQAQGDRQVRRQLCQESTWACVNGAGEQKGSVSWAATVPSNTGWSPFSFCLRTVIGCYGIIFAHAESGIQIWNFIIYNYLGFPIVAVKIYLWRRDIKENAKKVFIQDKHCKSL